MSTRTPGWDEQGSVRALLRQRPGPGVLVRMFVRPARGAPMLELDEVELLTDRGLAGDYASARAGTKRQVSLLQAEHLPVIAALVRRDAVEPQVLRRNLEIAGISVLALRAARFRIGGALLQGTGTCEPCSKMERNLGVGGYNAMRGHGGIAARVLEGGLIRPGDAVDFED